MIAHDRTVEEIADELGADSLAYLSLDGVYEAIGTPARGPLRRLLHAATTRWATPTRRTASSRSRMSLSFPLAADGYGVRSRTISAAGRNIVDTRHRLSRVGGPASSRLAGPSSVGPAGESRRLAGRCALAMRCWIEAGM